MPPPEEAVPCAPEPESAPRPQEAPRKEAPPQTSTVIFLKNGARFEGEVVEEKPDSVTLLTSRGKMCIPRAQIACVGRAEDTDSKPAPSGAREACLKFHAAFAAGDLEGVKECMIAEKRKELDAPDAPDKMALARAFLPREIEVATEEVKEDAATLRLVEKGGGKRSGRISLVLEEGEWWVAGMEWDLGEMNP